MGVQCRQATAMLSNDERFCPCLQLASAYNPLAVNTPSFCGPGARGDPSAVDRGMLPRMVDYRPAKPWLRPARERAINISSRAKPSGASGDVVSPVASTKTDETAAAALRRGDSREKHVQARRAPRSAAHLSSLARMRRPRPSAARREHDARGWSSRQPNVRQRQRWRQKRRAAQVYGEELYFKTGSDAVKLLSNEAERRDKDKPLYLEQFTNFMRRLHAIDAPVFDRSPKYAWLAKILLEPERTVSFKVTYIDDWGNARTNRGWRVQHSSSLGTFGGPMHFGRHVTEDLLRAQSFDATFANALTGRTTRRCRGRCQF